MYQLTCPSCKTPYKTPFVRMGAVAMCGNCSHKYPVKIEYFIKLPPENPAAPEMVDRLLGIVPLTPGGTGMAMPNNLSGMANSIGNSTSSGVVMPNVPPHTQAPPGKPAPVSPPGKAPAQTVAAQAAQPTHAANSGAASPAGRPVAQPVAAPAAKAPVAPVQAVQAAQEVKPEEPQESTGFFSKLFKRFK